MICIGENLSRLDEKNIIEYLESQFSKKENNKKLSIKKRTVLNENENHRLHRKP